MPSSSFVPLLALVVLISMVAQNVVVKGDPDLGYVSSFCGKHLDKHPPQMRDRAEDLTDWAIAAGYPGGKGFCVVDKNHPRMYAYSWCPATVTTDDCRSCLWSARSALMDTFCKDLYGAQLTLNGCFLRYETYRFCNAPP